MAMLGYLRDPAAIYAKSYALIRSEADLSNLPEAAHGISIRIIHACGMPEIAGDLRISADFADTARSALHQRRPIIVDAEMVRHGIIARNLPAGTDIQCFLNDPRAKAIGLDRRTTRSAAAVELWRDHLEGAVVVIGNAPTALFALLDLIDSGAAKPAAIAAFPVGFVGAAESKQMLHDDPRGIPCATLLGRKGGSAMAAAVINAIAEDMP